jgi:uncharacterized protein YbjT (DUF2867 family)
MRDDPVLVTGATGYVGGRLIPALLDAGYRVRAMGRSVDKLNCRPWARHPHIEPVAGDVLNQESLRKAARGCWAAYYLVHSMIARKGQFVEADRQAARNMANASAAAGVERIIYLGGLADVRKECASRHMRSRHEVGEILQAGPVPTTILQAAVILGSGSASFEILRYLVEHLPVMITPRWVRTPNQPIAIRNVVNYLVGCVEHQETVGQTYDIGGPDVLTYGDLLAIYAEEARLPKRRIVPVPFLTPTLSAYWIHLVTPVPSSIAVPLTEGLTSEAVCRENRIRSLMPQELLSCREAVRLALQQIQQAQVATCWSDAGKLRKPEWAYCGDADWAGGTVLRVGYRIRLEATIDEVWQPIQRIGGQTGWYHGNWLWKLRGWLDRVGGGPGLRRGRRHPTDLLVGDAVDFFRVLEIQPPKRLVLLSEMRAPGEALMTFNLRALGNHQVQLEVVATFFPRGLGGLLYWYGVYPFHHWIFSGLLPAIGRTIGKPVALGPVRFDPQPSDSCSLPSVSQ